MESRRNQIIAAGSSLILTALCLYFGTNLHPHWWATWFAPLPLLLIAPRVRWWAAGLVAMLAWIVGGLNEWKYFVHYIELPPMIVAEAYVGPAVVFTAGVLLFRALVRRERLLAAACALPAVWVAFEVWLATSANGTWGSLAYTQPDDLVVLQLAAVTGVWGIAFVVWFVPSAVAAYAGGHDAAARRRVVIVAGAVVVLVASYGMVRLNTGGTARMMRVGLASSDVRATLFPHKDEDGVAKMRGYATIADDLSKQGAQAIVFPEKIASMSDAGVAQQDALLEQTAKRNGVYILTGVDHREADGKTFNESRLYAPSAALVAVYDKHHLVPRIEDVDTPATARVVHDTEFGRAGLEICKDMDFPRLSREYGAAEVGVMLVPAWDFELDGWLHDRMAILRGVESGFSVARAAKQGLLSVSDDRGRVLAERSTEELPFATLVADVPVRHDKTLYVRWGNWFGWVNGIVLIAALGMLWRKEKMTN